MSGRRQKALRRMEEIAVSAHAGTARKAVEEKKVKNVQ